MLCWGHDSLGGQCCFAANSFYCLLLPIQSNLRGGEPNAMLRSQQSWWLVLLTCMNLSQLIKAVFTLSKFVQMCNMDISRMYELFLVNKRHIQNLLICLRYKIDQFRVHKFVQNQTWTFSDGLNMSWLPRPHSKNVLAYNQ